MSVRSVRFNDYSIQHDLQSKLNRDLISCSFFFSSIPLARLSRTCRCTIDFEARTPTPGSTRHDDVDVPRIRATLCPARVHCTRVTTIPRIFASYFEQRLWRRIFEHAPRAFSVAREGKVFAFPTARYSAYGPQKNSRVISQRSGMSYKKIKKTKRYRRPRWFDNSRISTQLLDTLAWMYNKWSIISYTKRNEIRTILSFANMHLWRRNKQVL